MTLDAQCGSSQQATSLAYAMVRAGVVEVALACGVESMSQVPMGSAIPPNAPSPLPAGYPTEWTSQFQGAELIAAKWGLTRAELDDFGLRSQARAAAAWSAGSFDTQIVPVGPAKRDEGLRETSAQALAGLKPIVGAGDPFVGPEPGRHTAATASQISDGAAAVLVMSAAKAETLGLTPLARIVDVCLVGSDPTLALTGPIPATQHLLSRNGLHQSDIDLVEINKAFAAVVPGLADLDRRQPRDCQPQWRSDRSWSPTRCYRSGTAHQGRPRAEADTVQPCARHDVLWRRIGNRHVARADLTPLPTGHRAAHPFSSAVVNGNAERSSPTAR